MIDTSSWKEFRVGDYFTQERGKEKAPKQNKDGDCPLIQETNSNNGFDRLVQPTVIFKGNAITISINYASNVFYQKDDFCASVNIAIIRNDNLNLYNGYFIASVLSSVHRKFDYQNKISKELIDDEIIKLPVTSDGQPDWDYMESCMKTVMEESEKSLENLRKADDTKHLIDVSGWHKCRLGDYFDFETGKDMLPTKEKDGDIPVVCLGSNNNGIGLHIAENPKHKLYDEGCITIAGWAGGLFAFYQEQKFYVKGRVKIAIPKQPLSKLAGLFMCTMIDSESWKYTYAEKASGDKLPNTELYLPITLTGEPDWQYMEDYMKAIMDKSEQIISDLQIGA